MKKQPSRRVLDPRQTVDLNAMVLETPLLKQVIHKQMSAMAQRCVNPDWLTFCGTDAWQMMHKNMTAEAQDRYELMWRVAYKSGVIQDALMKHPPTSSLEMTALAGHAMVYIWRELAEDHPERFEKIRPPLTPYGLQEMQESEMRLRVAGLFGEALRLKVIRLPSQPQPYEMEMPAAGEEYPRVEYETKPIVLMTRPDGDVDLVDYEREILEGRMPHTEIRWIDTNQIDTAATPAATEPGVLIGSRTRNEVYQRMPDGSLVNITKHPDKRRRDLEAINKPLPEQPAQ